MWSNRATIIKIFSPIFILLLPLSAWATYSQDYLDSVDYVDTEVVIDLDKPNGYVPNIYEEHEVAYAKQRSSGHRPQTFFNQQEFKSPEEVLPEHSDLAILLIGQTGSGKSTLLNLIANYLLDGSFGPFPEQQNVRFLIPTKYSASTEVKYPHSEKNFGDQSQSQTKKAQTYTFDRQHIRVRIIDTPGLGDTEGIKEDDKHLQNILKKAGETRNLAAVVFVINGTDSRHNTTQKYVFEKLSGFVPSIALENMIIILTNSSAESCHFPIQNLVKMGIKQSNIFILNNTVLASNPKTWSDSHIANKLTFEWNVCMSTLSTVFERIGSNSSDISEHFERLSNLRNSVMKKLAEVLSTLKNMLKLQEKMQKIESKYRQNSANAEDFAKKMESTKIKTKHFVDDPNVPHSTICGAHLQVCHKQCSLTETVIKGDGIFRGCTAFNGNKGTRCRSCSDEESCAYTHHYHARGSFVEIEETIQDLLTQYKEEYQQADSLAKEAKSQLDQKQQAFADIQNVLRVFSETVKKDLFEIQEICEGFNFVQELNTSIELLKQEAARCRSKQALDSANGFIVTMQAIADELSAKGFDKGKSIHSSFKMEGAKKFDIKSSLKSSARKLRRW